MLDGLSYKEKALAAANFIPGISTITGLITAIHFRNESNIDERVCVSAQMGLEALSEVDFSMEKKFLSRRISLLAAFSMIPLVNIFIAAVGLLELNKLSKFRLNIANLENRKNLLFTRLGVEQLQDGDPLKSKMDEISLELWRNLKIWDQNKEHENVPLFKDIYDYCLSKLKNTNSQLPIKEVIKLGISSAIFDYESFENMFQTMMRFPSHDLEKDMKIKKVMINHNQQ